MRQFYELLIAIFLGNVDIVLDKANWSEHASELMSGFLAVAPSTHANLTGSWSRMYICGRAGSVFLCSGSRNRSVTGGQARQPEVSISVKSDKWMEGWVQPRCASAMRRRRRRRGCLCSADTEAADASSLTRLPRCSAHPGWDSVDAPDLQPLASLVISSA